MKAEATRDLIRSGLSHVAENLDQGAMAPWMKILHYLETTAFERGLSGIRGQREIIAKHLADSCFLAHFLDRNAAPSSLLVDVGTGAGMPGLVLRVLVDGLRRVDLVDSRGKALEAIGGIAGELSLERIKLLPTRAELLGQAEGREAYHICVSRALASPPVALELCVPLVQLGGMYISMAGPSVDAGSLKLAASALGASMEARVPYTLPWQMGERQLLIFRKEGPTPAEYPRRPGRPERRPLGIDL